MAGLVLALLVLVHSSSAVHLCVRSGAQVPAPQALAPLSRRSPSPIATASRRAMRRKRGKNAEERSSSLAVSQQLRTEASQPPPAEGRLKPFKYLAVLDVEATCERNNKNFAHEIIELPVVLVDLDTLEFAGEFHTYVRPTVNATLSEFCTQLTGIQQGTIDEAPTLEEALKALEKWIQEKELVRALFGGALRGALLRVGWKRNDSWSLFWGGGGSLRAFVFWGWLVLSSYARWRCVDRERRCERLTALPFFSPFVTLPPFVTPPQVVTLPPFVTLAHLLDSSFAHSHDLSHSPILGL